MTQEKRRHEGALNTFKSRQNPNIETAYETVFPVSRHKRAEKRLTGDAITQRLHIELITPDAPWARAVQSLPGRALMLRWDDGSMIAVEDPGFPGIPQDVVHDAYEVARFCLDLARSPTAMANADAILSGSAPLATLLPPSAKLQ